MLNQAVHWMDIAATAVDGLLLLRVLGLRLHRIYVFITLGCLLALFFDGVGLWLGVESTANGRVVVYSWFLYAFVYPAIAWDVFEEAKAQAAKLRRMQVGRLISGIVLALVFGLLVGASVDDSNGESPFVSILALALWVGSSTASLSFLWFMRRAIRAEKIALPNNTSVWMTFYMLILLEELLASFFALTGPMMHEMAKNVLVIAFDLYGLTVTGWCISRLRTLPPDIASASEKARP